MKESPLGSRLRILSIPVDALDRQTAREKALALFLGDRPQCILSVNPEKVLTLRKDLKLRAFFERAGLLLPDGIGVVAALRMTYRCPAQRVAGADFMLDLCELAQKQGAGIFLFGSSEETSQKAEAFLHKRFPDLKLAGRQNGYPTAEEERCLVERINQSGAAMLFIAMGSPKQEEWIAANEGLLGVKIIQSVGGTLDTFAGKVRRAPLLFQKMHLEWFFRLLCEPKRIKRQWVLPYFALLAFREALLHRLFGKKA